MGIFSETQSKVTREGGASECQWKEMISVWIRRSITTVKVIFMTLAIDKSSYLVSIRLSFHVGKRHHGRYVCMQVTGCTGILLASVWTVC